MDYHLIRIVFALIVLAGNVAVSGEPADAPVPDPVLFSRDVVPILSRMSCNSSKCHAALGGKGHIQLSPLGGDPTGDFRALTHMNMSRRISMISPEKSLLLTRLTNPASATKLGKDSAAYEILHSWIAAGARGAAESDPTLVHLDAFPHEIILKEGETADVRVHALWNDDVNRDVTKWVVFASNASDVATVTPSGHVVCKKTGLALIQIRYGNRSTAVPITVRSNADISNWKWKGDSYIDDYAAATWQRMNLQPAQDVDEIAFVRRLYLQTTRTIPKAWETNQFKASRDPSKRIRLIDKLLASAEYANHWTKVWSEWLLEDDRTSTVVFKQLKHADDPQHLHAWLRLALLENKPIDQLVREILTAKGGTSENGAAVFYVAHATVDDQVRAFGRVFLGANLRCSRCHQQPHADSTSNDFYALAACFKNVRTNSDSDGHQPSRVWLEDTATFQNPRTGKSIHPAAFGQPLEFEPSTDFREALAEWLLTTGRQHFARNIVNRYWASLFGRGLIERIDDLRPTNPATHPKLLDALARDFIDHGYNAKQLIRTICSSRINRLDSQLPKQGDEAFYDNIYHSRFLFQRLSSDSILRILSKISGSPIPEMQSARIQPLKEDDVNCSRNAWRNWIGGYSLHFICSNAVTQIMRHPGGLVEQLAKSDSSTEAIVHRLFSEILSREPNAEEMQQIAAHVKKTERQYAIEDIFWALVNTKEFLFLH